MTTKGALFLAAILPAFLVGFSAATLISRIWQNHASPPPFEEFDFNKDGRTDAVFQYMQNVLTTAKYDRNFDGIFDLFQSYSNEALATFNSDDNFDRQSDVSGRYRFGHLEEVSVDTDFNGLPDAILTYTNALPARMEWRPNLSTNVVKIDIFVDGIKRRQIVDHDEDGILETTNELDAFERPFSP